MSLVVVVYTPSLHSPPNRLTLQCLTYLGNYFSTHMAYVEAAQKVVISKWEFLEPKMGIEVLGAPTTVHQRASNGSAENFL